MYLNIKSTSTSYMCIYWILVVDQLLTWPIIKCDVQHFSYYHIDKHFFFLSDDHFLKCTALLGQNSKSASSAHVSV